MPDSIEHIRSILSGRYRILSEVGRGGMAVAYLARDLKHDRDVVVKVLRPDVASEAQSRRFGLEIHIAAGLTHTHIVPIYDSGEADGVLYYVMPRVEGVTLRERLDRAGPLPVRETLALALDMASALDHAHAQGVVHRDIKPENVFVTSGGALVGDFGIALVLSGEPGTERFTSKGLVVGTPRYMSPEQLTEPESIDARSDTFSFGVVLFECVTGGLPFGAPRAGAHPMAWLANPPGDLGDDCPPCLAAFIHRCLSIDPDGRPAAGSLVEACSEVAGELSKLEQEVALRRASRRWRVIGAGLVAALGIITATTVLRPRAPLGPVVTSHEPVVTWSSGETEGRVVPGRDEISFLSDRGGSVNVWVVSADGAGRQVTHEQSRMTSHVWASTGDRLAYVTASRDGRFLRVIEADGRRVSSAALPEAPFDLGLARWVGDGIYFLFERNLWSFDPTTEELRQHTQQPGSLPMRAADVRADAERIVFTAVDPDEVDGSLDLWTAKLDGSDVQRLTRDEHAEMSPCWLGPGGKTIAYMSNRGGQVDVWQIDTDSRLSSAVTAGAEGITGLDCAPDGGSLVTGRAEGRADLWLWAGGAGEPVRLTADSRVDMMASASPTGRVAFQRTNPRLTVGNPFFDASIYLGTITDRGLSDLQRLTDNGLGPQISADGDWVTYQRLHSPPTGSLIHLTLVNDDGVHWELTERFRSAGYRQVPPSDQTPDNQAWSPVRSSLLFLEGAEGGGSVLARASMVGGEPEIDSLAQFEDGLVPMDLAISPGGGALAYVLHDRVAGVYELRVRELAGGDERTLYRELNAPYLHNAGWVAEEGPIVVARSHHGAPGSIAVEPLLLTLDGESVELPSIDAAIGDQARVSVARRSLLVPTLEEGETVGLHELPLAGDGAPSEWAPVLRGFSYSALEVMPDGRLIYARHERTLDIWKVVFEGPL